MKYLFLLIVSSCATAIFGQQVKLIAGKFPLQSPIEINLKQPLSSKGFYTLIDLSSGEKIPAQLKDSLTLVFIPSRPIEPGKAVNYRLKRQSNKPAKSGITISRQSNGMMVSIKDKPLFFYHTKEAFPPVDSPLYYKRSGFIHPLFSPGGQILTDDFPVAHIHQHAIFSAWVNTSFRNNPVDFWNQHNQTGTVMHSKLLHVKSGPVFTELVTDLIYKSFSHGDVLKEEWKIIIYPFSDYFLFDLHSTQQNLTSDTLFLKPYHYGGMAFRGSREWNPDDTKHYKANWQILTSEGMRDSAANATHARWVDASGLVDNKPVGATVMNHPSNFRYPQPIRVHPTMPYWCYAPVIDGQFVIAPGNLYQSHYRYFIHSGSPDALLIEELQKQWTTKPMVEITNN